MRPRNPQLPVPRDLRDLAKRGDTCEICTKPVCYGECCFPPISMATVHFSGCHRHTQDREYGHPWQEEYIQAWWNREMRKRATTPPVLVAVNRTPFRRTEDRANLSVVS
jgi:hypothetical protein